MALGVNTSISEEEEEAEEDDDGAADGSKLSMLKEDGQSTWLTVPQKVGSCRAYIKPIHGKCAIYFFLGV